MFCKNENERLLEAPNFVYSKEYSLLKEEHASYTYPIDGWNWFETREEALTAYGITEEENK